MDNNTVNLLANISLALFRKNFFGIYHGAISSKIDHQKFVINKSDAIFDKITSRSLCELHIHKEDYNWNTASMEAYVHASIYEHIHEAKYIAFGMPPYTTAYTFEHDIIEFKDFFGKTTFETLDIYNPKDFETWYQRNSLEIAKYLKNSRNNIMVIKGVGVYVIDRDINELVKKVAILENSCRLLSHISSTTN